MCRACGDPIHKATAADFLQYGKTPHTVRYLDDLEREYYRYMAALIVNVFDGVARSLGVPDPDALAEKPPWALAKGFLSGLKGMFRRLKGIFGRKADDPGRPFTIKGRPVYVKGKPMTVGEFRDFEKQVTDYMRPYLDNAAEEITVKAFMLAMASARAERQGQRPDEYGKRSYKEIEDTDFKGYVPDTIQSVKARYRIPATVEDSMIRNQLRTAQYVQRIDENVRNAIRAQVLRANEEGLTPKQLASNLYWMKKEDREMRRVFDNPSTAEQLVRDWHRVAVTEIAYLHEAGKMALFDAEAAEGSPVYFVFGGSGRCDWCASHQGAVVRLIPLSDVGADMDDSLSARGINDPHTDIAVWQGKSNFGFKKAAWRVTTPAHPYCRDTFIRFFPGKQRWNAEKGDVENIANARFSGPAQAGFWSEVDTELAAAQLEREKRIKERDLKRGYSA